MKIFIHDKYQDDSCTFCGDDGMRFGLVEYIEVTLEKQMPVTVTPIQLRALIETDLFPEKQELLELLEQYPNSKINIMV